jgi:flagellar M-ring protein FliF
MAESVENLSPMSSPKQGALANFIGGVSDLNMVKQIGLMVGLAASVALGLFVVLWSQTPSFRPLGSYDESNVGSIMDFLEQKGFEYKMDPNGRILVPMQEFDRIRLHMMKDGVSEWLDTKEIDFLDRDTGFGVSQRLERARLLKTRENDLSRTIREIHAVKNAKVHLAIPKENVFARRSKQPSATVMLQLHSGRRLLNDEVDAIVNMVASSVPGMTPKNVTVVDQKARLLNSGNLTENQIRNRMEFESERQREQELKERVTKLMENVVGRDKYHVEVNVDMDFSHNEQTEKVYNPDMSTLRSEAIVKDISSLMGDKAGVPGALTSQPPATSTIPQNLQGANGQQLGDQRSHIEETKNYEIDTTVTHTRQQVGVVRRITVSVGVDYVKNPLLKTVEDDEERAKLEEMVPRPDAEIANIRRLISGAVGLNPQRGDVLEVLNFKFAPLDRTNLGLEENLWEDEMVRDIITKAPGWVLALIVIFGVLRPVMKRLSTPVEEIEDISLADTAIPGEESIERIEEIDEPVIAADNPFLPGPLGANHDKLAAVKSVVGNEPELVAQVIKSWIESDV